jgi:heptaprenyl diphosphate synthase
MMAESGLPMIENREMESERLRLIAIFAAFSMFAATLEYLFPRPVPFFRLGLANLPIIMAFHLLDFRSLMALTLLKVLGQGLVNGTLASYVFLLSLTGSFASVLLMYGLFRLLGRRISFVGLSLAGALASNSVQSLFSVLFIFGQQAWVILPLFYGLGFAAGLVIGFLAELVSRRSLWFYQRYASEPRASDRLELSRHYRSDGSSSDPVPPPSPNEDAGTKQDSSEGHAAPSGPEAGQPRSRRRRSSFRLLPPIPARRLSTPGAFAAGLLSLPMYLLVTDPLPRLAQVVILGLLTLLAGKRLLYAYFFFLVLSVTFFHLLIPQGRVLFTIGTLSVTEGALFAGIYRGTTIIGLVFISLFSIRRDLYIPGTFGRLVSRTLRYFEHIYEYRKSASIGGLVARLDRVLFELTDRPPEEDEAKPARRWPLAGDWLFILPIVLLMALPVIWQYLA